jgi:hypothetical protein
MADRLMLFFLLGAAAAYPLDFSVGHLFDDDPVEQREVRAARLHTHRYTTHTHKQQASTRPDSTIVHLLLVLVQG